ncbi:MAG: FlhC family transcriptional regulator, partial [Candidatus Methylumidiphilus sp.]
LHTQMPLAGVREWHREIHGRSPSSGLLPSMSTLLPNPGSQIHVSLFAAIYRRLGGDKVLQEIDIHALVEAWDLFDALTAHVDRKRPADLTDAWVIARDMRARSAAMLRCHKCVTPFLVAYDCKLPPTCPVCYEVRQGVKSKNPIQDGKDAA